MYKKNKPKKQKTSQIQGTKPRIRLCVTKSRKHIYAQIINDKTNHTLCSCSTSKKEIRSQLSSTSTCIAASLVGSNIANAAIASGINSVVFDRRSKLYHGKIKAIADAARQAGLNF